MAKARTGPSPRSRNKSRQKLHTCVHQETKTKRLSSQQSIHSWTAATISLDAKAVCSDLGPRTSDLRSTDTDCVLTTRFYL